MVYKRSGWFYIALFMAFSALLLRTFWLSTGENSETAASVVNNRNADLVLYRTKGLIYDENLNVLAGNTPCWYLVINPREFDRANINLLVGYTGEKREVLAKRLRKETPFILQSETEPTAMNGVCVFEGVTRYSGLAKHLLGYLDGAGEVGLAGVEKEYNDYLSLFSSTVSVSYDADALRGIMEGAELRKEEETISKNGVVLSLNAELCRALEQSMDQYIEVGAAIVLDCKTGAIKATASRPEYNENEIAGYLNSTDGELINRAFSAQSVGSVFKIVLAACALEAGLEQFSYTCNGGIVIGDLTFACHNHAGHGTVGLQDAFAQSCNSYFIALGQILGYDRIAEMASRFGYGEPIEVLGSMVASKGIFPAKSSNMALANLSIGQGELLATPLQIARMTAVVANGGILPQVYLYKGLYLNSKIKVDEGGEGVRIIDAEIAEKLKLYCIDTVENGTGKAAKPAEYSAGGKTASAQTGIIQNGKEKLNVYFTGFYPAEDPQYVITVFAEDGESGGKTCSPVFREICDFIAKNGLTVGESVVY